MTDRHCRHSIRFLYFITIDIYLNGLDSFLDNPKKRGHLYSMSKEEDTGKTAGGKN